MKIFVGDKIVADVSLENVEFKDVTREDVFDGCTQIPRILIPFIEKFLDIAKNDKETIGIPIEYLPEGREPTEEEEKKAYELFVEDIENALHELKRATNDEYVTFRYLSKILPHIWL